MQRYLKIIIILSEILYTISDKGKYMRTNYKKIIERIIAEKEDGSVFITSDFVDIASFDTVNRILNRLSEDKKIHRIIRGIYYKAKFNNFINEYIAPETNKVAEAIARNFGWNIIPCGVTALNLLGLSTQVPAVWQYMSDGNYKEYTFGKTTIYFKRTTNKEISKLSYKTALIVQALKALGKNNVKKDVINKISKQLTIEEKKLMFYESKNTTAWIYQLIKLICTDETVL